MMGSRAGWKGLESGSGRGQGEVRHEVVREGGDGMGALVRLRMRGWGVMSAREQG